MTDFALGDRVAYCLSWGSYAEFAVVTAWRVVPVPDALSLDRAAAFMFHGLTAHYLATDHSLWGQSSGSTMSVLVEVQSGLARRVTCHNSDNGVCIL